MEENTRKDGENGKFDMQDLQFQLNQCDCVIDPTSQPKNTTTNYFKTKIIIKLHN